LKWSKPENVAGYKLIIDQSIEKTPVTIGVPHHTSCLLEMDRNKGRSDYVRHEMFQPWLVLPMAITVDGKFLLSGGHWDHSFTVSALNTPKIPVVQTVKYHYDVVTCIAVSDCGRYVVTGSKDTTVVVWEIHGHHQPQWAATHTSHGHSAMASASMLVGASFSMAGGFQAVRDAAPLNPEPSHVLLGHDDAITCVAVNSSLDMVASSSMDGTVITHALSSGVYLRSICRDVGLVPFAQTSMSLSSETEDHRNKWPQIHWVGISIQPYIVTYSKDDQTLATFSINGEKLATKPSEEELHCFTISDDGKFLLTGGSEKQVVVRHMHNLEVVDSKIGRISGGVRGGTGNQSNRADDPPIESFGYPIRSITLTFEEKQLLVGLENGQMRILTLDESQLQFEKLQQRLDEMGMGMGYFKS